MLPVGLNRPTAETHPYEQILGSFKVNELHALLQAFRVNKTGKKHDVFSRCVELLRTPSMTKSVIEKIREIEQRLKQQTQRHSPYSLPTIANNNFHQQQQPQNIRYGMNQQNRVNYGAYSFNQPLGGMASLPQGIGGAHLMSNVTPRPSPHLTPMPLPFYDPIYTLLDPQELPASCNPLQKLNAQVICTFSLSSDHHMRLSVNEQTFPRTEVQLRFFNTTGDILNIEQTDDFPLNCNVKINDLVVNLPNVIPTNKPNVEPKRPSRPVNITSYVLNQPREKLHRMRVDWMADKRQWAVAIYLVSRVNSDILRNRLLKNPMFELPYETTEATIRKRLGGDDDDVAMDTLKISLLCPLMKTRMTTAARSRDCSHLQCFDLDSYLMLNEKKPVWKCGVCSGPAPYSKLIIDKYFMKMLTDLGQAVTDVELLKDGSYRVIKEDDCCDLSDSDEDVPKPKAAAGAAGGSRATSSTTAPAASAPKRDDDVITISDDEEDHDLRNAIQASMPGTATEQQPSMPRTPVKACSDSSSDDSIIVLDDTPPRPDAKSSAPPSAGSGVSSSSSTWRQLPSSVGSSSSAAAVTSAAAPATSSAYDNNVQQQQQQQLRAQVNLADALNQAGLRPSLVPGQLQLNAGGGPLSAAASIQPLYNWAQQQPQSAPPMMNPQAWNYAAQMPQQQFGYFGMFDPRAAQQAHGYGAPPPWAPPNGAPVYPNAGVIRRDDAAPRDPRDPHGPR